MLRSGAMYVKGIGLMDPERIEALTWWGRARPDDPIPAGRLSSLIACGWITKKSRGEEGWVLTRRGDRAIKWVQKKEQKKKTRKKKERKKK